MRIGVLGARIGFYLAMIGSACGLGNLWRFPYIVDKNGGGAFVLLYLVLVFIIGMPLLIGELLLGKASRKPVLSGLEVFTARPETDGEPPRLIRKLSPYVGYACLGICLFILGYFSVISGWVMLYLYKFTVAMFSAEGFDSMATLNTLVSNGMLQMLLCGLHLVLVVVVVGIDIEDGMEKFVGFMMPLFGFLLCLLTWKSLSLDTTEQALRYMFYPNFSKLTLSSLGNAVGQVLFTLSIGFTTMVTFGRFLPARSNVPLTGFRLATVDSVISILGGMLVFPLVISFASVEHGPLLLFETVPQFVQSLPGGSAFGFGFFLCLYLGAFAASLSLLDTVVANFRHKQRTPRWRAASLGGFLCFIFAMVPALSSSVLRDMKIKGLDMLEVWDMGLINWLLPVVAVLLAQVIYYYIPRKLKHEEFKDDEHPDFDRIFSHWRFTLKWLVPILAGTGLFLQLIDLLISNWPT